MYLLEIVNVFKEYYSDLYKSKVGEVDLEIGEFFQGLIILQLSEEDKSLLDLPIAIEELQEAALDSANHKAPGPDGLPNKIYREYGEIMLPELLQVLNEAMEKDKLPVSMTEAAIIIIPKEGKDPLQPLSYRPISLLCVDVKLLTKILASR